jgi:hypothetical protein
MALFDDVKGTICPEFSPAANEALTIHNNLFTEPGACKSSHTSNVLAIEYRFVVIGFLVSNRFSVGDFSQSENSP